MTSLTLPGAGVTPINCTGLRLCSPKTSPTESHRFPSRALGITARPSSSVPQPQVGASRDFQRVLTPNKPLSRERCGCGRNSSHTRPCCSLQLLPARCGVQSTAWAGRSSTDSSISVAGTQPGQPFTPARMKVPPQPAVAVLCLF